MVNKEDFIKRLEKVIDYYDLSASAFADVIGVQRSSISHLLSGRNNPSLDFVMKILENFPEVELYWLLNGKGSFPKETKAKVTTPPNEDLFSEIKAEVIPEAKRENPKPTENSIIAGEKKEIARIVVFYKNGTFEEYKNVP
ncbi:helix-turn-helix transcriptional regulator [Galbibacter sp. BG1]|uniref:helix-turn-helix domain-containing protein n=1 Tax=Galbibacter sp. BG1 TaxID=1170699 RepID=UPI0015BE78E0|nr:helix-turn-helix transcriptional regulator [Galbibacter sp. BG1]QLE02560.1 helix-turn-helix transcriptional regulator [Galbibacter sp. BG1]